MFWCCGLLCLLLLLGDACGDDVSSSRVRRQSPQGGQVIDNIFNVPITAIKEAAAVAQVFSPENTQAISTVMKIPISTLEAVGSLVKSTMQHRQQNGQDIQRIRQQRRDHLLAIKEDKRKRKEEIRNQRLQLQEQQQQHLNRVVRHHYNKDPLGLDALSHLLVGHHGLLNHHHVGGLVGHHTGLDSILKPHKGHRGHKGSHGGHGHGAAGSHGPFGNQPQNTYAVHEDVNEDISFSWQGLTAGFGSFTGSRPSGTSIKIENKVAPKDKKILKYTSDTTRPQNKLIEIENKPERDHNDPPIENKIAPRNGKVTFVR